MSKFKKALFGVFVLAMVSFYSINCFAMKQNNNYGSEESRIYEDVEKKNKNNILNMRKINKYVLESKENLNDEEEVISYFGAEFVRKILLQKLKENLIKRYNGIILKIIPSEYFISKKNNKVDLKIFEKRINSENFIKFKNIFEFVLPLKFREEFDLNLVVTNLKNLKNDKIFKSVIKETIDQLSLIEEEEFNELKDKALNEDFYYQERLFSLISDDEKYNKIIDQLGKIRKNISFSYLKNLDNFMYDIKFSIPDINIKGKSKIILENMFKNGIKDDNFDFDSDEDKDEEYVDENKITKNIKESKKDLKEKNKSCVITNLPYKNKYIFKKYLNDSRKNLNFNQTIFDFIKQSNDQYGEKNIKEKIKDVKDKEKVGIGLKIYNPSYMMNQAKFNSIDKGKFLLSYIFLSNIPKSRFNNIKLHKIFDKGYLFKRQKDKDVDKFSFLDYSTDEGRDLKDIGIDRFYDLFITRDFNSNLKYPEKIKFDKEIFDCIVEYKDQFLSLKENLLNVEEEQQINIEEKLKQLTDNTMYLYKILGTFLNEEFCKEIKEEIRVKIGKNIIEQLKDILDDYFQKTCTTKKAYLAKKVDLQKKLFKMLRNKDIDEYLKTKKINEKLKTILKNVMLTLKGIELNFLDRIMKDFKSGRVSLTKDQFDDLFSLFSDLEIDLSTNKEFQKYVRNFKKHFLKEKFKVLYNKDVTENPAKILYERIDSICGSEINLENFKNYVKNAQIKFDLYKYNPDNKYDSNCGIEQYKLESKSLNVRYMQRDYIAHILYQNEMLNELENSLDKKNDLKCIVNSGIFEDNTVLSGLKSSKSYISLLIDPENNPYKSKYEETTKNLEDFYKNISSKVIDSKLKKIDEKEYEKFKSNHESKFKIPSIGGEFNFNSYNKFKLSLDTLEKPEFRSNKSYGFFCNMNEDFYTFYYSLNYVYFVMFSEILKEKLKDYVDDVQIRFKDSYNLNYLLCDKVKVFLKFKKDLDGENELKDEIKNIVNNVFLRKDVNRLKQELEYNKELDRLKIKALEYLKEKDKIKLAKKENMINKAKEYFYNNNDLKQKIKEYFDYETKSIPESFKEKLEIEFKNMIKAILHEDRYEVKKTEGKKVKSSFLEYIENRNKKEKDENEWLKQKIESYVKSYKKSSRAKKAIHLALCEMKDDVYRKYTKWENNSYEPIKEEKIMEDLESEILEIIKNYYDISKDEKKLETLREIIDSVMALCMAESYKMLKLEYDDEKEEREQLDNVNWKNFEYENNSIRKNKKDLEEKSNKIYKRLKRGEFFDKNKKNSDILKSEVFKKFLNMKQDEKKLGELREKALKYIEDKDKKILYDEEQIKNRVQDAIKNFGKEDIVEEGLEDFNVSFHDIEELK